jgi:hypothetical protein
MVELGLSTALWFYFTTVAGKVAFPLCIAGLGFCFCFLWFLAVLGFELRASYLLGSLSTA